MSTFVDKSELVASENTNEWKQKHHHQNNSRSRI